MDITFVNVFTKNKTFDAVLLVVTYVKEYS